MKQKRRAFLKTAGASAVAFPHLMLGVDGSPNDNLKAINASEADQYLGREYCSGWKI
ncbi:MAG: hypothetical protein VCA36_10430 [Opitutales bacterium]